VKRTIYIETTIFSFYFDDRPAQAFRRQTTRDWWRTQRRHFDLVTSPFAVEEAAAPVYPHCRLAGAMARRLALLEIVPDIAGIVKVYVQNHVMPAGDAGDAAHLAVASYHGVDYLLTWNCRHLANANKFEHIRTVNRRLGLLTPELVTPEQLFTEV
jgi:predicted nucleic acid-binding protein